MCLRSFKPDYTTTNTYLQGAAARANAAVFTDLWDVVVPSFPLIFLQLDGDSPDGAPLDTFHQMGHKAGEKKDIGVLSTSKDWVSADFNKFDLKLKTIMHAIELAKVLDFENR